ncbi:MAG: ssl1498 family light-harvesting-like protein [Leptolyngbyaceae cyanobacterium bins.302]|nr:ssl1498 family light-harvesting-like protein [Leptolyngbyaceae cyanobacterium bins.302]
MYTTDNEGLLNNYAVEPAVYYAEFPSEWQQQRYALQGAVAALVVALTIFTAISVS